MDVGTAILPQNNSAANLAANVFQIAQQRKAETERKRKEDEARQNALVGYLGKEFDYENYATGTAADPLVVKQLQETKTKLADIIRKNPGMGAAELMMMAQQDAAKIAKYSAIAKNLNTTIKSGIKEFEDDKGLDAKSLERLALQKAFMKKNDSGQWVIKDPSELEQAMQEDHVGSILTDHPELVTKDNTGFISSLSKIKTNTVGDKRDVGYMAELHPFDEITKDEKGNPSGIRTRQETVQLGNTKVPILADDAYQMLFNTASSRGTLNKELKRMYPELDPRSEEAEIVRRKIALDMVEKNVQGRKFVKETSFDDRNDEWSRRKSINITVNSDKPNEKAETKKEKLRNSPIGILARGIAGDESITGAAQGNEYNQITGGLTLETGRDKADSPYEVVTKSIKKNSDGSIVVVDNKDRTTTYQGAEIKNFLKRVGKLNGLAPDEVQELVDEYFTASGKSKKQSNPKKETIGGLLNELKGPAFEDRLKSGMKKILPVIQ
jgi:hypothetical protein